MLGAAIAANGFVAAAMIVEPVFEPDFWLSGSGAVASRWLAVLAIVGLAVLAAHLVLLFRSFRFCPDGSRGSRLLSRLPVGLLIVYTVCIAWALAWYFSEKYPLGHRQGIELLRGGLTVSLTITLWSGAWLFTTALRCLSAGILSAGDHSTGARQFTGRMRREIMRFWLALTLRALVIVASVAIGLILNSLPPGVFVHSLRGDLLGIGGVRILLGLILPGLFAGLVWVMASSRESHRAPGQFLFVVVMIAIAEILAAFLTVGLWGIAL